MVQRSAMPSGKIEAGRPLIIERIFDAPRAKVWKAFNDPEIVKCWHGPKGYTAPVIEEDFRVGGKYLYAMQSPDGQRIWSTGVYKEIVPFERIVATDSFADEHGNVVPPSHYGMPADSPVEMMATFTFSEHGGETRLTLRHDGVPAADLEFARDGWQTSFDKLDAKLMEDSLRACEPSMVMQVEPGRQEIIVTRTYDAPAEKVFKAVTDVALIPMWWGPRAYTTKVVAMDVRPGGEWRFVQRDADGTEFGFHGFYHSVEPPVRIIQTFEYEGTPGHVLLETITLAEENGKTVVTDQSVFQSVADRDGMVAAGMEWGARESTERLAALL